MQDGKSAARTDVFFLSENWLLEFRLGWLCQKAANVLLTT